MKKVVQKLINHFYKELQMGLQSPATLVLEYGEGECLKLEIEFIESGGGPAPDDEPYLLRVEDFNFYYLDKEIKWNRVNPLSIGVSKNDF